MHLTPPCPVFNNLKVYRCEQTRFLCKLAQNQCKSAQECSRQITKRVDGLSRTSTVCRERRQSVKNVDGLSKTSAVCQKSRQFVETLDNLPKESTDCRKSRRFV